MPANWFAAIWSRSLATVLTRTVKPCWPAWAGNLRRLPATVRKLRAAESSLLLDCEFTAEFHWLIASLLLALAVLQAATGSGFAAAWVLLLALALLEVGVPDVDDGLADELPLPRTDRLADGALLVLDRVGRVLDVVMLAEDEESAELPLEQALNPTRPHAAIATTLSRRAWAWVVLIAPGCPGVRPVAKSRDDRHAPSGSTPRLTMAGCASTQSRT